MPSQAHDEAREPVLPLVAGWAMRPVRPADAPDVLRLLTDPDVAHARSAPPPGDEAAAARWIEAGIEAGERGFVVEHPQRGFAGLVLVQPEDGREASVGYLVVPEERGKGLATAALIAATRWAFADLGVDCVALVHDVDNAASCRVARRAGYCTDGLVVDARTRSDGTTVAQERHVRHRDGVR